MKTMKNSIISISILAFFFLTACKNKSKICSCPDPLAKNFNFEHPNKDNFQDCKYESVYFYYSKDTLIKDTSRTIVAVNMKLDSVSENNYTNTQDIQYIASTPICGLPGLYNFSPKFDVKGKRDFHWTVDVYATKTDTANNIDTLILTNYRFGKFSVSSECQVINVLN